MCELLALSFNKKVNAQISFTGFRKRGNKNPDGWGFAFYPDKAAQIFKEPKNAADSKLSDFIRNYPWIESNTFIAHVRRASKGSKKFCNAHPFSRELFGREYIFAHNGTLENFEELSLKNFKPIGETDSEHAFCYILSNIKEKEIRIWDRRNLNWLKSLLSEINELGSFNCIMSDGVYLFCYRDISGYNGLKCLRREPPFDRIKLADEDFEINLMEHKSPEQKGYIIATSKLTDERWKNFEPGSLMVFKSGEIIYK